MQISSCCSIDPSMLLFLRKLRHISIWDVDRQCRREMWREERRSGIVQAMKLLYTSSLPFDTSLIHCCCSSPLNVTLPAVQLMMTML